MTSDEIRKAFDMKVTYTTESGYERSLNIWDYFSCIEQYLGSWLYKSINTESQHSYFIPIYNSLAKDGKFTHYMYPWSKDEVKEMNEYILELYKFYLALLPSPNNVEYYSGGFIPSDKLYTIE